MPKAIFLSDSQMTTVLRLAEPLPVADRDPYLRLIAELLAAAGELGAGAVHRAAQVAQRQFLKPPTLEELRSIPSNRPRSRRAASVDPPSGAVAERSDTGAGADSAVRAICAHGHIPAEPPFAGCRRSVAAPGCKN